MWRVKGSSGELSFTVVNAQHHFTFPAPMIFSAAYTESPHLEHFSAPPYFWANFEVLGFVVGLWGWTLWKGEKLLEIFQRALVNPYGRHNGPLDLVLHLMAGGLPRPAEGEEEINLRCSHSYYFNLLMGSLLLHKDPNWNICLSKPNTKFHSVPSTSLCTKLLCYAL